MHLLPSDSNKSRYSQLLVPFRLWQWCFVTTLCIFRLCSQVKHSDRGEADTAASTEDSTSTDPAAIHTAPYASPAAAVSKSIL